MIKPTIEMRIAGMEASLLGRPSIDDESYVASIWTAMWQAMPADVNLPLQISSLKGSCKQLGAENTQLKRKIKQMIRQAKQITDLLEDATGVVVAAASVEECRDKKSTISEIIGLVNQIDVLLTKISEVQV